MTLNLCSPIPSEDDGHVISHRLKSTNSAVSIDYFPRGNRRSFLCKYRYGGIDLTFCLSRSSVDLLIQVLTSMCDIFMQLLIARSVS